jgi:hypothetical protein
MRSHRTAAGLAVTAAGLAILSGCGSSPSGATATATPTATPAAAAAALVPKPPICTEITGVLGNGPDSDADPVGYAEAQIGPLAQVHAGDPKLASALASLDAAFKTEFAQNASTASLAVVTRAEHRVNAICPGAAS